jgi:hypothetical protein
MRSMPAFTEFEPKEYECIVRGFVEKRWPPSDVAEHAPRT